MHFDLFGDERLHHERHASLRTGARCTRIDVDGIVVVHDDVSALVVLEQFAVDWTLDEVADAELSGCEASLRDAVSASDVDCAADVAQVVRDERAAAQHDRSAVGGHLLRKIW